jgi:hypothetical protein
VNREQLLEFARSLNVSVADADTDEQIHQKCLTAISSMNSELEPLRRLRADTEGNKSFAEQFPEQAARMAKLEKDNLEGNAFKFSEGYSRFWTETIPDGSSEPVRTAATRGFSELAKEKIQSFHVSIVEHTATVENFGEILDLVASGKGIVEYKVSGSSTRNADDLDGEELVTEGKNSREVFHALTKKVAAREENKGKSFAEIFTLTAQEFPKEHEAWQKPLMVANNGGN